MKETQSVKPEQNKFASHSFSLHDRKKLEMTGVNKVESSNETEIVLTTCLGRLVIAGSGLKIARYDTGDGRLELCGTVDSLKYAAAKQSLLKRIFK